MSSRKKPSPNHSASDSDSSLGRKRERIGGDGVANNVTNAINAVLAARMGVYGFDYALVTSAVDAKNNAVLIINAYYDPALAAPVDTAASNRVCTAIREALQHIGDFRYPLIRHQFTGH